MSSNVSNGTWKIWYVITSSMDEDIPDNKSISQNSFY